MRRVDSRSNAGRHKGPAEQQRRPRFSALSVRVGVSALVDLTFVGQGSRLFIRSVQLCMYWWVSSMWVVARGKATVGCRGVRELTSRLILARCPPLGLFQRPLPPDDACRSSACEQSVCEEEARPEADAERMWSVSSLWCRWGPLRSGDETSEGRRTIGLFPVGAASRIARLTRPSVPLFAATANCRARRHKVSLIPASLAVPEGGRHFDWAT